jgi:hypothetical protein
MRSTFVYQRKKQAAANPPFGKFAVIEAGLQ